MKKYIFIFILLWICVYIQAQVIPPVPSEFAMHCAHEDNSNSGTNLLSGAGIGCAHISSGSRLFDNKFIPTSNYLIHYVQVNLIFLQRSDGSGNFQNNAEHNGIWNDLQAKIYENTFHLDEKTSGALYLALADISAMAKIKVNGEYAGGLWMPPYRLDISNFAKKGDNTVSIEVTTTWVNRLIGDSQLPAEERKTWAPVNNWNANSPLQKSGLTGPVCIMSAIK